MTTLTYPRRLFRRQDVIKAKSQLSFPLAWKITKDKRNFYLTLTDKRFAGRFIKRARKPPYVKVGGELARRF